MSDLFLASKAIDGLFRADTDDGQGGFPCGEVTEVAGVASSGKTQLCYTLCANVLRQHLQTSSTTDIMVVWLYSQGCSFRAKRFSEIASRQMVPAKSGEEEAGLRPAAFLDRILVARVLNTRHLHFLLEQQIRPKVKTSRVLAVVADGECSKHDLVILKFC